MADMIVVSGELLKEAGETIARLDNSIRAMEVRLDTVDRAIGIAIESLEFALTTLKRYRPSANQS